jgi:ComF family protein
VAFDYARVAPLITALKLHDQLILAEPLARAWLQTWQTVPFEPPEALIPMPLHWTRLLWRGFNQSALVARHLARALDLPFLPHLLTRSLRTRSQRTLSRQERRRNVRHAFTVRGQPPRSVALVDDVITTGATADAAARALKRAGCRHVEIWCIAKTAQFK